LGNQRVKALDHTRYEGAEVVHDLTKRVPWKLKGKSDFIVGGSTLDNCFDPAVVLQNYTDLLRPSGRLFVISAWSNHHNPYVMVSPLWLFDYFVVNRFDAVSVYVGCYPHDRPINAFVLDAKLLLDDPPKIPGRVNNFVSDYEMSTNRSRQQREAQHVASAAHAAALSSAEAMGSLPTQSRGDTRAQGRALRPLARAGIVRRRDRRMGVRRSGVQRDRDARAVG
jgi:SAM-dependent methyltransferase